MFQELLVFTNIGYIITIYKCLPILYFYYYVFVAYFAIYFSVFSNYFFCFGEGGGSKISLHLLVNTPMIVVF